MNITTGENFYFETSLVNIVEFVEYFAIFYTICVVTSKQSNFQPAIPGAIILSYEKSEPTRKILLQKSIENGCQAFVISDDIFCSFLDDFYEVHDKSVQVFPNKHVLIYQSEKDRNLIEVVGSFSVSTAISDLPNILFIEFDKTKEIFNFLTTKFEGRNDESSTLMEIAKVFKNENPSEKLRNFNLYPEKVLNLQGRDVVLAIFNYMPYVLWKKVSKLDEKSNAKEKLMKTPLFIDGTETWVFLEFCKKLNCNLLISLDEAGEWGEISDNQTGNGILGAVAEKRADVGVGALYSWHHESLFLSLSKPISRTGITCITPKPNLLNPIGTPTLPFSRNLWMAVIVSYLVSVIAYEFLRKGQSLMESNSKQLTYETLSETFLNFLGVFVLQSVKMNLRQLSTMVFLVSVLIAGLMIGNSYSSALATVLTIPRFEKAIDTVEELASSNMEWASTHDAWIFSIQQATQPMILQLLHKFKTYSKEVLEQHAIKQDLSFSIERLPYGHYAIGEYVTEKTVYNYQIMTNDIYYELCVAMSTKTWPLMSYLDDLILQIAQSGIQQFVELDVVMRNSNNKIQAAVSRSRHKDNLGPINLTPKHLNGPFILLGFGLIISTLSFALEIVFKLSKNRKNHIVPLV